MSTQQVQTELIADSAITTAKLAALSVTAAKIAAGAAVSNIGAGGITSNELASTARLTQMLTSGTAVASTSGTSIDFTSIPSWVKRITISFAGVSTSGAANLRVRIGPVGGVETSGYIGASMGVLNAIGYVVANLSAGFDFNDGAALTAVRSGSCVLTLLDPATNTWAIQGGIGESSSARYDVIGGHKALAGALSIVRITTGNGTDTFDAGSINILYE